MCMYILCRKHIAHEDFLNILGLEARTLDGS
jgi:hypothetical protein